MWSATRRATRWWANTRSPRAGPSSDRPARSRRSVDGAVGALIA
jgi:hypothetical protein